MKIQKGYKFRLLPTPEQERKLNEIVGQSRKVYNAILGDFEKAYQEEGRYFFL